MNKFNELLGFLPTLLAGAEVTVRVSIFSFGLALILGLVLALMRLSPLLAIRALALAYIEFVRGTPLLLQLFFIYYVLPYGGVTLSPFAAGVSGLALNYAAYMAEVFRSGIQAVPSGQREAGLTLGMSTSLLMRRIIVPQAFRIVLPAVGNFFISIFKDSALVSVITMRDLMFTGQLLAAETFRHFEIYALVGFIYFGISFPASKFVSWLEERLRPGRAVN
jgi:polar amino acid transport system permease protein